MITNTQRRIVNLWYFLTLIFLLGIFVPSWVGMKGMEGGFGLSFLSGFLVLLGIIVIFVYRARARQMDKILDGEGIIAHWQYSAQEWMRFVSVDFMEEKKTRKNLYLLVTAVSVAVGIMLILVVQELIILPIIAGILVIVAIPAFLVPRYRYRKLQHSEAEVLITGEAVIVGKMFHLWKGLRARLELVSLETNTDPAILSFQYSMPTRNGRQTEIARVPVPAGKLREAGEIVNHFNNLISS